MSNVSRCAPKTISSIAAEMPEKIIMNTIIARSLLRTKPLIAEEQRMEDSPSDIAMTPLEADHNVITTHVESRAVGLLTSVREKKVWLMLCNCFGIMDEINSIHIGAISGRRDRIVIPRADAGSMESKM